MRSYSVHPASYVAMKNNILYGSASFSPHPELIVEERLFGTFAKNNRNSTTAKI